MFNQYWLIFNLITANIKKCLVSSTIRQQTIVNNFSYRQGDQTSLVHFPKLSLSNNNQTDICIISRYFPKTLFLLGRTMLKIIRGYIGLMLIHCVYNLPTITQTSSDELTICVTWVTYNSTVFFDYLTLFYRFKVIE